MAVFDFAGSGSDEAVLDITAVRTGSTSSGFATTFKTMIDVSQLIKVDFWLQHVKIIVAAYRSAVASQLVFSYPIAHLKSVSESPSNLRVA